eukprot:GHVS01049888.1.p1 GENE.GHVS01049888.1~~GHVS01049888.1.p1  ORF type:complete len:189 (+),score=26.56 GHVS01049888.1:715-1281(+)
MKKKFVVAVWTRVDIMYYMFNAALSIDGTETKVDSKFFSRHLSHVLLKKKHCKQVEKAVKEGKEVKLMAVWKRGDKEEENHDCPVPAKKSLAAHRRDRKRKQPELSLDGEQTNEAKKRKEEFQGSLVNYGDSDGSEEPEESREEPEESSDDLTWEIKISKKDTKKKISANSVKVGNHVDVFKTFPRLP